MYDTPDDDPVILNGIDRICARHIETAANIISGLELSEIGEDGHLVANKLWKIESYLRKRAKRNE